MSSWSHIFSENPNELSDWLRLTFQVKQAGNDTKRFDNEIIDIVDKLLEFKPITPKQHQQILIKFYLLHKRRKVKQVNNFLSINIQLKILI